MTTKVMTGADVRAHVMSFIQALNSHEPDKVVALMTDDVLWMDPSMRMPVAGREAARKAVTAMFTALPDMHFPLEDVEIYLSEDEKKAIAKWRVVATMTGPLDPPGFGPTGKTVYFTGVCTYDFRDGLISRHEIIYDFMDVGQQLGLLPAFDSLVVKSLAQLQSLTTRARKLLRR